MTRTHDVMIAQIMKRAQDRGILAHYCRNSRSCFGDNGLPDLILAGPYGTAFYEVKTGHDIPSPAQTSWAHMLRAGGQEVHTIRERYLDDGSLELMLDALSTPAEKPDNSQLDGVHGAITGAKVL